MRAESSKKMTSFLQRILGGKKPAHQALSLTGTPAIQAKSAEAPEEESRHHAQTSEAESKLNSLFAFVDPKDPFAPGELAEEQFPGPILSILSAKKFDRIFLFYTPHTRKNAQETEAEALQRYPECRITLHELPISDPKNYRVLIGLLRAIVQKLALAWRMRGGPELCVCFQWYRGNAGCLVSPRRHGSPARNIPSGWDTCAATFWKSERPRRATGVERLGEHPRLGFADDDADKGGADVILVGGARAAADSPGKPLQTKGNVTGGESHRDWRIRNFYGLAGRANSKVTRTTAASWTGRSPSRVRHLRRIGNASTRRRASRDRS